jgi:hypothetical protein
MKAIVFFTCLFATGYAPPASPETSLRFFLFTQSETGINTCRFLIEKAEKLSKDHPDKREKYDKQIVDCKNRILQYRKLQARALLSVIGEYFKFP